VVFNRQTAKAVEIYNNEMRKSTSMQPLNIDLGFTPNGVGLKMTF
jgi:hypothetical protein